MKLEDSPVDYPPVQKTPLPLEKGKQYLDRVVEYFLRTLTTNASGTPVMAPIVESVSNATVDDVLAERLSDASLAMMDASDISVYGIERVTEFLRGKGMYLFGVFYSNTDYMEDSFNTLEDAKRCVDARFDDADVFEEFVPDFLVIKKFVNGVWEKDTDKW